MSLSKAFFERLHFEERLARSSAGRFLASIRTVGLITITLTAAGLAVYLSLPKELNPAIQIPTVIVNVPFPGANTEDIESLVTLPVEEAVSGLADVNKVTSSSQESFSTTVIEFASTTEPKTALDDVQNAVNKITTFPADAEKPVVTVIDFQDQPTLTFALAENQPGALPMLSDLLEERLKATPGIEKVNVQYRNRDEVSIFINPDTLAERHLSWERVIGSVGESLASFPGGTLASRDNQFALVQEKSVISIDDVRKLPLALNGSVLSLETIARVANTPERGGLTAFYADTKTSPTRAILFSVFKTKGADTQTVAAAITKNVIALSDAYPGTFTFGPIFDGAYEIEKSFNQLLRDFLVTFGLVFVTLFLFFGLRQSVITTLAIPLSFLATFIVMGIGDISVSFIALFALLLALGILVDNAIVIVSAFTSYYRSGKFTPLETALLVFRDFRSVIFTTTLTTIWAFLPLLLSTGIIGEFIRPIPIVVSSALAASAAIALFIVLPFMAVFLGPSFPRRVRVALGLCGTLATAALIFFLLPVGPWRVLLTLLSLILVGLLARVVITFLRTVTAVGRTRLMSALRQYRDHGLITFDTLSQNYATLVHRILISRRARRMTLTFLILFMIFSYALVPTGYVVNEFFPGDDQDILYVTVSLPPGSGPERATAVIERLLPELRTLPELSFAVAEIGAKAPIDNQTPTSTGPSEVLFTLKLAPAKMRLRTSTEIAAALKHELSGWDEGTLSVVQLSGGPPAGADLQLTLLGTDRLTLQALGQKTKTFLEKQPGVSNVSLSIQPGTGKIVYHPDLARFQEAGIHLSESGSLLRLLGSGITIKEDSRLPETKYDVTLRVDNHDWSSPDLLGTLPLITQGGQRFALSSLGHFSIEENPTLITREDEKRSLSVSASVSPEYSISQLNQELERFAGSELNLPEGYNWKTGGVNEENNKSVRSILLAMLLSAALIFGTMAVQFNSFRKALIVLLAVPLAISGVFVCFALFGIPLSFPALIGVLALFGIVVNNSIIMVDKMSRNLALGLPFDEAIVEGASSRLEPIVLTALTTIIGLIPITLSDPIWRGLGGAIIAGLTFSGIAKLFFIPVIYRVFFPPVVQSDQKFLEQSG